MGACTITPATFTSHLGTRTCHRRGQLSQGPGVVWGGSGRGPGCSPTYPTSPHRTGQRPGTQTQGQGGDGLRAPPVPHPFLLLGTPGPLPRDVRVRSPTTKSEMARVCAPRGSVSARACILGQMLPGPKMKIKIIRRRREREDPSLTVGAQPGPCLGSVTRTGASRDTTRETPHMRGDGRLSRSAPAPVSFSPRPVCAACHKQPEKSKQRPSDTV